MDNLWTYCKEGKFTDIQIVCQGGVLKAHKAMLSLTMPVIQLMDADMILMPDTSVQYLESELRKLYDNQPAFSVNGSHKEQVKEEHNITLGGMNSEIKVEALNEFSDDEEEDDSSESHNELNEHLISSLKSEDAKISEKEPFKNARGRAPNENKGVCIICQQTFNSNKSLLNHLSKYHNQLLKCKHCPEEFLNYEKLSIHKQEYHKNLLKYQCGKCDRGYKIKSAYEEHLLSCGVSKEYYCQKCGNKFSSKKNLYDHNSKVHAEGNYECLECGKTFTNKVYLTRHKNYAHLNMDRCSCHICGKTLANSILLNRHVKAVHEKVKEYRCPHCLYESGDPKLLKSHIDSAHLGITYECDICHSVFTSKTGLYNHSRTVHSDLRPFICQECGEAFKRKKNLDTHIDNKHSTVIYSCTKCEKVFKSKLSLDYHLKTHDVENQFPCEVCGRRFITRTKLKMHMNTHTGETPYKCPGQGCMKAFHSSDQLSHHKKQCAIVENKNTLLMLQN